MAYLHAFGQSADGRRPFVRQGAQGEKSLVLLRLDTSFLGGLLREVKKAADFVAKVGKSGIVHTRAVIGHVRHTLGIVSLGDRKREMSNLERTKSEGLVRVEKDGDGTVVDEFDGHVCLKDSGFDAHAKGFHVRDKFFVE